MNITHLTKENFRSVISETPGLVLVDFWADWCGPCKMFSPILDKVAAECSGSALVCKLNIDEASDIAEEYGVFSIPTVVLFENGKEINRNVGVASKDAILNMLKK